MYTRKLNDTICALATPAGVGGIGVIRVSGTKALDIVSQLLTDKDKQFESHKATLVKICDFKTKEILDSALTTFFEGEKSFTGENTVEISCHGSPIILESILNSLIDAGARAAERGEFSFRAFMNGKVDLIQAESINSLIHSQSHKAKKEALLQLDGSLSKNILEFKNRLTKILANVEAEIDFSLEDLPTLGHDVILAELEELKQSIRKITETYRTGQVLSNGFKICFVGEPNVGKSSLFNAIIETNKAIVTEEAGTTRDLVDYETFIEGVKVKFFDTAGIRESKNIAEQLGIKKTIEASRDADLVLCVFDQSQEIRTLDFLDKPISETVFLANKSDLKSKDIGFKERLAHKLKCDENTLCYFETTSFDPESLIDLKKEIVRRVKKVLVDDASIILKTRQYESLSKAEAAVGRAMFLIKNKNSQEFIAFEIRETLEALYELLGEKLDDEVLDKVFKEFCIGK